MTATTPTTLEQAATRPAPPEAAPEDTTELVGHLWQAAPVATPLDDWEPEELSPTIRSRRNFRWTVVVLLVAIGGIAWFLAAWLPGLAERQAQMRADEYRAALIAMRVALPDAQRALAIVTDPDDPTDEINEVVVAITGLAGAAGEASAIAAAPLPDPPPLVSDAAIRSLEPSRQALARLADEAAAISERVQRALDYRTKWARAFDVTTLPVQADPAQINELSVDLAAALADTVGIRSELPDDPAFQDHLAAVDAAIAFFETWQVDYLDALRNENVTAAIEAFDAFEAMRRELDTALLQSLATLRTEVDAEILGLAGELERALEALPL